MQDDFSLRTKSFSPDSLIDFSEFSKLEEAHVLSAKHPFLRAQRAHAILTVKEIVGDPRLEVAHEETGRPFLRREDGSRDARDLSISHKRNQIFIGLTRSPHRIGVDLEEADPNRDYRTMVKHALAEGEEVFVRAHLMERQGLNLETAFSAVWAVKEAYIKAADLVSVDPKWLRLGYDATDQKLVMERWIGNKHWKRTETRELSFQFRDRFVSSVALI